MVNRDRRSRTAADPQIVLTEPGIDFVSAEADAPNACIHARGGLARQPA